MSTTHSIFTKEELESFVCDLKDWPATAIENEDYELAVSPFITFYFLYTPELWRELSLMLIEIHDEFQKLTRANYKVATHPGTERPHPYGSKKIPDLRKYIETLNPGKTFSFGAADESNTNSSPTVAGYFCRMADYMNRPDGSSNLPTYSYIQFYYRWTWWQENKEVWRRFVLNTIETIRPDQVYSGFAMCNPLAIGCRAEVAVWERGLTEYFFGLDIDYPFSMSLGLDESLAAGIRPPTWGFLLTTSMLGKLGYTNENMEQLLREEQIGFTNCDAGYWIELGGQPGLIPVEHGVPRMHRVLNEVLRPLRNNQLSLLGFGQWDGDPNVRFNRKDTVRWLGRFDADSDWPDMTARVTPMDSGRAPPPSMSGGSTCPKSGWWFSPSMTRSRRFFQTGDTFPDAPEKSWGMTIWQWDSDQSDPSL